MMSSKNILGHIWFDFSDTIASINEMVHHQLRDKAYSEIVGRPVSKELATEFEELYEKYHHSNAAVFHSLGKSSGFWSAQIDSVDPQNLYSLVQDTIPETLREISHKIPISIFSNIDVIKILPSLGIDVGWFANIISSGMVKHPKPALDGFFKMIDLSAIDKKSILYIGDDVEKDIRPAKQVGIQAGIMWGKSSVADYSFRSFEDILQFI